MREIELQKVSEMVYRLFLEANFDLPEDVLDALKNAYAKEESPIGREVLDDILKNAELARAERMPLCQDTGFAVVFAEVGQDVHFVGDGSFTEAINDGVSRAYREGYLRKSILADPLNRASNTGDNTPAVIWTDIVPGDKVKLTVMPKGGGSENMSTVRMMKPADGWEGVKRFVVEFVEKAGGNPCPPIVVGVAIGGTFEKCANLAKKALLRRIGRRNQNPEYARLEEELLEEINKLGVGPMGLGGTTTALDVHIEYFPCHIATFPVAVNIGCHSERIKEGEI